MSLQTEMAPEVLSIHFILMEPLICYTLIERNTATVKVIFCPYRYSHHKCPLQSSLLVLRA